MTSNDSDYIYFFNHILQPACILNVAGEVLAWNNAMNALTDTSSEQALNQHLYTLGMIPNHLSQHWRYISQGGASSHSHLQIGDLFFEVDCIHLPNSNWALLLEPQKKSPTQADVLYTILHDLKNPLAAIKGYAELIGKIAEVNDMQQRYIGRIQAAIGDMQELIYSLLDVAWVDSGIALQKSSTNLSILINDLAGRHAERAQQRGVNLELKLSVVPEIPSDERRIKQVLNNLIGNAIKYTKPDGRVTVSTFEQNGGILVSVEDTGVGISEEYQEKIFQRFFRVPDSTTDKIEGTGLGLAISYEILKRHGVELKLESTPAKGSKFYFMMPLSN